MPKSNFCPLINGPCKKKECKAWNETIQGCSVHKFFMTSTLFLQELLEVREEKEKKREKRKSFVDLVLTIIESAVEKTIEKKGSEESK